MGAPVSLEDGGGGRACGERLAEEILGRQLGLRHPALLQLPPYPGEEGGQLLADITQLSVQRKDEFRCGQLH